MKKLKLFLSVCIILTLITSMFVGCQSENDQKEPSGETTKKQQTQEFEVIGDNLKYDPNVPVNDGQQIDVSIWVPAAWEEFYRKWTEEYRVFHPNVNFKFTITSFDDHWKKVPLALQSGTGPDLFWMHNSKNEVVLQHMQNLPEDRFPMDKLKKDFRQVESNIIDGKLYYTDLGLMTGVIFYNTDMWEENGFTDADIPGTWDELIEKAKKLTKYDDDGNIIVAGFNTNDAEYLWNDLMYQQGKWLFDEEGDTAVFQSPEGEKAAQLMSDLYHKHNVGDGMQPKGFEAFANGKAAMIYCWGWASNYYKSNFPDLNYSAFAIPVFDESNVPARGRNNGDVSLGVSNKSKKNVIDASLDFVKYQLSNNEMLIEYDVFDGMAPTKYSLDTRPEIQNEPVLKVETEIVDKTVWPGPVPDVYFVDVQKYIGQSILINNKPIKDALEEAEKMTNRDLDGLNFKSVEQKYSHKEKMSHQ